MLFLWPGQIPADTTDVTEAHAHSTTAVTVCVVFCQTGRLHGIGRDGALRFCLGFLPRPTGQRDTQHGHHKGHFSANGSTLVIQVIGMYYQNKQEFRFSIYQDSEDIETTKNFNPKHFCSDSISNQLDPNKKCSNWRSWVKIIRHVFLFGNFSGPIRNMVVQKCFFFRFSQKTTFFKKSYLQNGWTNFSSPHGKRKVLPLWLLMKNT